jgi:protein-disulfide isomerase
MATLNAQNTTQILDPSALKPPAGARVAIIEFYDLECPACARANPTISAAAAKYKIPLVRHDFLIPGHVWSPQAALNARWFDTKSKAIGEEYRNQVFANQRSIYNLDTLRDFTNKFAQSHGLQLPFAIDPQGTLAAAMKADNDIGTRTGIRGTPGVFVAIANSKGAPYIEVHEIDKNLYQSIDQALSMAGPASSASSTKKPLQK